MRDQEAIDSELPLLAAVRRSVREHGIEPSSRHVDELLDERLAHRGRAGGTRQSTRSGGPYTIAPHSRHVQLVWPPRHEHGW